jgi:hypothetical protein
MKKYLYVIILIIFVACVGIYFYKIKNSNVQPITATYNYIDTDDNNNIEFNYTLKNNTNKDYEIKNIDDIQIFASTTRDSSLYPAQKNDTVFNTPVFVPANQSVQFSFSSKNTQYLSPLKATATATGATSEALALYRNDVANYLTKMGANTITSFLFFDTKNNYKIIFPVEWDTTQTAN